MDKNSIIGLLLIGALIFGYMFYSQPSEEDLKRRKEIRDSILAVQAASPAVQVRDSTNKTAIVQDSVSSLAPDSTSLLSDSAKNQMLAATYGSFAGAAKGEKKYVTIENEKIKLAISTLGGRVAYAELKQYKNYKGEPLLLFDEEASHFGINFFENRRAIATEQLFFQPDKDSLIVTGENNGEISLRVFAGAENKYVEYVYILHGNSYLVDFVVNFKGVDDIVKTNSTGIGLSWNIQALSKEKFLETELSATTVFFKYMEDEVDYIAERNDERLPLDTKTKWVSFKQQYFSAAVISETGFDKTNSDIESRKILNSTKYTKYLGTNLTLTFPDPQKPSIPLQFYFGPNHYQTLKAIGLDFENQIDLGWMVFGWMNKLLIIPIFNFLERFNMNYGLIILILTLVIKAILFPLTYRNFISSAKMRVLKPEIDEMNAKLKNEDPLKKQQAMMGLYKKAGVNPMAGCIPMLLQMPILYAMFRFFPSSIELRQEHFLWADDLSSYESIYDLGFSIPFYGDHVSLFTLLMAVSTFVYTIYNMQMTTTMGGAQAMQMKIMAYFMPVMLLCFFNNYSAALSYYYFLTNVISIAQQFIVMKFFIDEAAIHRKIEENKKRPQSTKKSGFQQRLEDLAKRGMEKQQKKKIR